MKLGFKLLGGLFAILFVVGAVLQYNDPDVVVWILIYGFAATTSVLFALNKLKIGVPLAIAILCFIGFVYLYPSNFQGFDLEDGDITAVELGREAFGLLIISLVHFVYALALRKNL